MQNIKVNYLIGTWSGLRNNAKFDDGVLKRHLAKLDQVEHSLSQISIGHPHNPDERREYTSWIMSLKETAKGVPIKVHSVPNNGRSYGQWSHMFNCYRDQFTHFIFIEDDYVPVKNNFDRILVDLFDYQYQVNKCGFLCGLVLDKSGRYGTVMEHKHAAIANGISSNTVLNEVWRHFQMLPHDRKGYSDGQVLFSQGFLKTGFTLQEYLNHYRCLYWQHADKIRWYWDGKHNEDLIVPIQYLDEPSKYEFEEYRPTTTPTQAMAYRIPPAKPTDPVPDAFKRSFQLNAQRSAKNQQQIATTLARRRALGY